MADRQQLNKVRSQYVGAALPVPTHDTAERAAQAQAADAGERSCQTWLRAAMHTAAVF